MHLQLQQSPPSTQIKLQQNSDQHESILFTPKSDILERRQYKIRTLKHSLGTHNDLGKNKSFQNLGTGSCFRCREQGQEKLMRLCQCQNITYHSSCILNHAKKNPHYGISVFQCENCNEYFQITFNEKLGIQNLSIKEQYIYCLLFFVLICFILSEIIVISIIEFQIIYLLLIIILIILELIVILILLRILYKKCQQLEFNISEYNDNNKVDQQSLQIFVKKILEALNNKKKLIKHLEIHF